MASAADVLFAQLQVDENNKLLESARKASNSLNRRRGKMGIGRVLGAVGGGLLGLALAPISGGASLYAAIGAGLGSRIGSEAGQRGAFGNASVSDVEIGKLNRDKARDMQSDIVEGERALNRSANVNMLSDAFSAYTLAGTRFGQGAQQFAKNPVQFTKTMFTDATAPNVVPQQALQRPTYNFNNNQRLDFLNTAAENDALFKQLNTAQARGLTGPSNVVQQVGGNLDIISTPMFPAASDVTNTYNAMNPANINSSGVNFNPNQSILVEDLFNQFYGGPR